jgi:hypothetical protein
MSATAPRSWDDVISLVKLAAAGNEDAEFYLENAALWKFPWEQDLISDHAHDLIAGRFTAA